jgi:hypothetical protein
MMRRPNEQRATIGALKPGGELDAQELTFRELFCLVGNLALRGLLPGTQDLAEAVFNHVSEYNPLTLVAALGDGWAASPASVMKWLSRLDRWRPGLFLGGPFGCKRLTVKGEELLRSLQQNTAAEGTAQSIPSTKGQKSVSISDVTEDKQPPQPIASEPKVASGLIRVIELLEKGSRIKEIQNELTGQAASAAQRLKTPLNKWIKLQIASTFEDRKDTCQFINDLLSSCGVNAIYEKTPCYFSVSKKTRYPEGVLYLIPFGGSTELTARLHFADLPDIELAPAHGVATGSGQAKHNTSKNTERTR